MCVGRGGEGGGGGSWKLTERLLWSSKDSGEGLMGWLMPEESSGLRLVTGVVLFGGIGGDGLAGTRLAPPCVKSPKNNDNQKADGRTSLPVSQLLI